MDLKTITTNVPLAVTESELEEHINLEDGHPETTPFLEALIKSAQQRIERATARALTQTDYLLTLDDFPAEIQLGRDPIESVASIEYLDTDWNWQTLATTEYFVSGIGSNFGVRVRPAKDKQWPDAGSINANVKVTFRAGYGASAADVPADLKSAVLMLAAHLYENREATLVGVNVQDMPMGVEEVVDSYRTRWF